VDLESRRVTPFPEQIAQQIAALHQSHLEIERPAQTGHVMGIRRK